MSKEMTDLEKLAQLLVRWEEQPDLMLPCAGAHTTGDVVRWVHAASSAISASAVAEPVAACYSEQALAKFLWENCALIPERAGEIAHEIIESYRVQPHDAHPAPAAPVPASVREALTDIDSWRYDTLGQRPRDESAETEVNAAFDRGARMAFYRCSDRARDALASLPAPEAAPVTDGTYKPGDVLSYEMDETTRVGSVISHVRPEAAPTREEIIEQCAAVVGNMRQSEAGRFDDPKYAGQRGCDRSDALYDAYRAILALKAAPHQS